MITVRGLWIADLWPEELHTVTPPRIAMRE